MEQPHHVNGLRDKFAPPQTEHDGGYRYSPSLYLDYPKTTGGGAHYISHWLETDDYEKSFEELLALGYTVGHSGNIGPNGRFAYLINDKLPGTIIEISEMSGFKGEFFKAIAEICQNWDGSDPIRR